ncbi:uncharacterized protein ACBT44_006125 isoform 1-T1 [Syngnathus typhle]
MEQDQERHLDVRPKRRTHPPAWMQDFEVDYVGYEHSGQPRWDSFTPTPTGRPSYPQQGLVQTISLRAPQFHPESFEDAAQYRAPQLASSFTRRRNADDRTLSAPVQSYQQQPNQDQYHPNRHTVQDGNAVLRETHEAIHAGLKELNKARSDLQQLIDVAHSLRIGMSQVNIPLPACSSPKPPDGAVTTSNSSRFTESEEEEDWPDPPPWPEPEEALNANLSALNLGAHQLPPYPTPPETKPLHYRPQPQPAQFRHPQFIPSSRESSHVPPVPPRNLPLPLGASPTGQPHLQVPHSHRTTPYMQPPYPEPVYRGPQPTIPKFTFPDPSEFARLRIALENLLPSNATELFKYQVLVDHLKLEEAKLISDAYLNSPTPYTDTMTALYDKYGQPHQLALKKISSVLDGPEVRRGDPMAFQKFALQIQSLVGLLQTLGHEGEVELSCGSHVARLLSKLPPEQRADFRRSQPTRSGATSTLRDLSEWLRHESWCQDFDDPTSSRSSKEKQSTKWNIRPVAKQTAVLHSSQEPSVKLVKEKPVKGKDKSKVYCAYCESTDHYLSQCSGVAQLTKDELKRWIQEHKRCWRCARRHFAAQCDLKKPCNLCQGKHLLALHDINIRPEKVKDDSPPKAESCLTTCASESFYLDRPHVGNRVMLKVVRVHVHYGSQKLDTYAILDDGSERTMLLPTAAKSLALNGAPEDLPLRTVRSDIQVLHGHTVSFRVSSPTNPNIMFKITDAFTASHLNLAPHSYPVSHLQRKFKHLRGIPIPTFREVKPLLLIGSDQPHLVTPIEPVRLGPHGSPAAVRTRLGWTLQGPCQSTGRPAHPAQCLFTSVPPPMDDLYRHVERLWQVDTVPYRPEREVTRSKQDQQAIALLETKTGRTEVSGILRYATPLLRHAAMPLLQAPKESVMALLRSTERRLLKNPEQGQAYQAEMRKLIESGAVQEISEDTSSTESWFIPHHLVTHNGKNRLVFNCSHQFLGQSLNQFLLPGPTLGASLLAVLLRFREGPIAVSGDIKGMFHQVRLLPEDRPLLRFLWRDLEVEQPPKIFEWQVLPFGTTCSPCCATYALQRHVKDPSKSNDDMRFSVEHCFYVDNYLQSVATPREAKGRVDRLRKLLASGGFELRQWACNDPNVLSHLPSELRSTSLDLWLAQDKSNPFESTLGLSWNWQADSLGYKQRLVPYDVPTLRNIYRVLASQYDPLGYLLPFSIRAKLILRQLWDKQRGWDDPNLPPDLLQAWSCWEAELKHLPAITMPRPYAPADSHREGTTRQVHIFADASEKAYGAVAFLRTEDNQGKVHLSFVLARSRIAPKRVHSVPRLELCAALVAAQLASTLKKELALPVHSTVLWSDSTTVLTWLHSQSCRYKVFVGSRVAEIQELTEGSVWRYVDSDNNPADDLTRGKTLISLLEPNRWSQGPTFLLQGPTTWPEMPHGIPPDDAAELRKGTFCGSTFTSPDIAILQDKTCNTWQELMDATARELHGQAPPIYSPTAEEYRQAEVLILQRAQKQSFPDDCAQLSAGRPVKTSSRLLTLAPVIDTSIDLIRVGGRLRRLEGQNEVTPHPIVLDASHPVTRLLIKKYDQDLKHPGPERVFAELRRTYWIIHGREAVRRYQRSCVDCQRWRAKPSIPKMADLPTARLQLHKPAFHATGMDCFGPMLVKVGRRHEKRWGLIFKCLTTRAVHLDLIRNMDTDAFLMALRRFIARRGTPSELWSDHGTNFKGGEKELREAFTSMCPTLQSQLAPRKIKFNFNPPAAPHFGGVWEREVRAVKSALRTCLGTEPIYEDVLSTVLLEVEAILNSKPLGYVSADLSDVDPVTPNSLLLGRPDGSLPQIVHPKSEILSRRRWRHSQVLADQFWSRFIRDYLPGLQTRQKWQASPPDLLEKSVVMITEPQLPRAMWPIGHVTKIHRSDDGHIRSADVDIKGRQYTRPVARLVVLPALPAEVTQDSHKD